MARRTPQNCCFTDGCCAQYSPSTCPLLRFMQTLHCWGRRPGVQIRYSPGWGQGFRLGTAGGGITGADPALLKAELRVQRRHCWGWGQGCRPFTAGDGVRGGDQAPLGAESGVETKHCWGWGQRCRPCTAGGGVRGGD